MTTKRIVCTAPDARVRVFVPNSALVADLMALGTDRQQFLSWVDAQMATGVPRPDAIASAMTFFKAPKTEDEAVAMLRDRDVPGGRVYREKYRRDLLEKGHAASEADALIAAEETAAAVTIVEVAALPNTRRFRDCWRRIGASLPTVDMPLARAQRMNEVRSGRVPKLAKVDLDILRAEDTSGTSLLGRLRTYRQALRDVPQVAQPSVDAITAPDALAAWVPTWPVDPAP